jgi:hypothetical protein
VNSRLVSRIDSSVLDGVPDVMSQAYAHNYQCRYDVLQTCQVNLASTAKWKIFALTIKCVAMLITTKYARLRG